MFFAALLFTDKVGPEAELAYVNLTYKITPFINLNPGIFVIVFAATSAAVSHSQK